MAEHIQNAAVTSIDMAAGLSDTDVSLTVLDATVFTVPANFRVIIDSEILLVTAIAGNVLTVTRGEEGTTATAHANKTAVNTSLTVGGLRQWIADGTP